MEEKFAGGGNQKDWLEEFWKTSTQTLIWYK